MLRPKLPAPLVYTPTPIPPAAPVVQPPTTPVPACGCHHHAPATPAAPVPVAVQPARPPLGLYLAGGTIAVAGVVALAVAVTALFLAIAVTAVSVTVAAVVLRNLLADHHRGAR